jgi:hypothetical protein
VALTLAASAPSAGATVPIGSTFTPAEDFGGSGTFIQSTSPGNSYAAPTDGVITRWSYQSVADPTPPLKLKILRPAGGDDFTTVGDSQLETVMPTALNTFPTRIAVKAGDLLGEFYSDTTFSFTRFIAGFGTEEISGTPGDPGLDPPPGTTVTYSPNTEIQIDVAAVLEPDADHDGFGDETQDKCVGTAGTFNGCPSTVAINSAKQKGKKPKVKVTATVPGAGTLKAGSANDASLVSASSSTSLKAVSQRITSTSKQQVTLTLTLRKSAKKKLAEKGKLKTRVKVVYTPAGGPPASQTAKVKLRS